MARGLYVEIEIDGSLERVWELTQRPALHEQWDLRFSSISYLPRPDPKEPQRFTYATRIGLGLEIAGTGESLATRDGENGERTSSLRFFSDSPLSLITEGSGYWKYQPTAHGIRFLTWYDYTRRWGLFGRLADVVFRPAMGWATAWSFDRLRLWVEQDVPPHAVLACTATYTIARAAVVFVWLWHGVVPKLLLSDADELRMLREAGVHTSMLPFVGWAEVGMAVLGLLTWRWRGYLPLTAALMLLALAAVCIRSPEYVGKAFNPVTLNICMLALSMAGAFMWRFTAFAGRCHRRPGAKAKGETHE